MAGAAPLSVTLQLIDKATGPLRGFAGKVNDIFKPFREIKNRLKLTTSDLGIPKMKEVFKGVGNAAAGVTKEVKGLAKEFALLGGVAAGFLGGIVYATADAGDAAYKMAQKVGISTEAWSGLKYAADMSGVSSETLKGGLIRLNKQITDTASGNKTAAKWFDSLGISVRDQNGGLKSADTMMGEVAEKLSAIEDGSVKTRLAMELFGKSAGPEMITLLNAGKEGIDSLTAEAKRLGIIISDEQGQAAESFNDSIARVKEAITGLTYAIGNQLIPIFEPWIKYIEELITSNRELISNTIAEWIQKIQTGFEEMRPKLVAAWESIVSLAEWVDALVQDLGGWGEVLPYVAAGLALLELAPLIASVISLATAVGGLGVALLTTPIGWIVLGIAALVAGFVYLWRNCEGFRNFWISLWETIRDYVLGAVQRIRDAFDKGLIEINPFTRISKDFEKVRSFFAGFSLKDEGVKLLNSLWEGLKEVWDNITGWFSGLGEVIASLIPESLTDFNPLTRISKDLEKVRSFFAGFSLKDEGAKLLNSLWEGLKGVWDSITGWFSGLGETIAGLIPESLTDFLDTAKGIAGSVAGTASGIAGTVGDTVAGVGGAISDWWSGGGSSEAAPATFQTNEVLPAQVSPAAQVGRVLVEFLNVPNTVSVKPAGGVDVRVQRDLSYLGGGLHAQ